MAVEGKGRKKTILRAIRLDKELDEALDKDAEEHGVSENALISSILSKYIEWDRYAEKFGRVSLPSEALKAILEATEQDRLSMAAEEFAASEAGSTTGPRQITQGDGLNHGDNGRGNGHGEDGNGDSDRSAASPLTQPFRSISCPTISPSSST